MKTISASRHPLAEFPVGLGYFALSALPLAATRVDGGPALVWLATALLFARLSLLRPARWPPVLLACGIASFLASALFGFGPAMAPAFAVIALAEGVASVWLLRRWLGGSAYLETPRGVAAFALVAGGIVPAVAALAASALIGGHLGRPWFGAWQTIYAAHALGTIVFAPILMLVLRGEVHGWLRAAARVQAVEAAALLALVALVSFAVFGQESMPLLFLPALPIMAATLRLGRAGAAASLVILAAIGGVLTLNHHGPITLFRASLEYRVQIFQFYLAATTMLVLPVAALLKQNADLVLRLSGSEARYRLIAEHSGDAILNVAVDGTILYASPAVTRLAGFAARAVEGRSALGFIFADDRAAVSDMHRRALANPANGYKVEYRVATADGVLRWFETSMRAVVDADGRLGGAISTIRDVTARKQTEARLAADANTDALTGLPNRRAFMTLLDARIAEAGTRGSRACVALFDIDWFKAVNDRYGHAAGDAVLVAFARAARETLREEDALARIGGEEFALILAAPPEEAFIVCERLRKVLSRTAVRLDTGASIGATVSAGVAALTVGGDGASVLAAADAALYRAKAAGRDQLVIA